MLESC